MPMQTKLDFCSRCVMDGSAEELTLDENGVCNFCHQAQKSLREIEAEKKNLPNVLEKMKKQGKGKKYDVLIGLSGGVDSSFLLFQAVKMGLRPLCFSIDNGWQDPKADENIMRLIEGLKVPFYRYTIDIPKFRKLQAAFLKAGLINLEIPTDHILMAASYEMAEKYGIKYILSGGNVATESIMAASWSYPARDLVHIKDVYRKMMGEKLEGLPLCSLLRFNWYRWVKEIKTVYLLDYLTYNRNKAIEELRDRFGYLPYGEKHCESVYTHWFQNFYLYTKFGIDKRKAHLSSEINSGQMTLSKAKEILAGQPVYPNLGLEWRNYPKHSHYDFKTDEWLFNFFSFFIRLIPYKWRS